ncbi:MAG: hypothetical protein KAG26_08465 [Methylococcales bacterium]|nr:hypothetical protein [Methylococcales bacterium]
MERLKIIASGELFDVIDYKIAASIDSNSYLVDFEVQNWSDYLRLSPEPNGYVEVDFDYFGNVFRLILEDNPRSTANDGSEKLMLQGRGKNALLSAPHSKKITKNWRATTAKTIAQELCDAVGVTLNWKVSDWMIKDYSASSIVPMACIKKLVGEDGIGAIIQPSIDGKLVVCYRDKISPRIYSRFTPDHTISDDDHLFSFDKKTSIRELYDSVSVGNELRDKSVKVSIETLEDGDDTLVRIYVVPFHYMSFRHSALVYMSASYEGVKTVETSQEVVILNGKGALSKPFYGLVSKQYYERNLGRLDITEAGEITLSGDHITPHSCNFS